MYFPSRYDIALLRLSSDATLKSYVTLGSLPSSGQILPNNNPCFITGWGRTSSQFRTSSDSSSCSALYSMKPDFLFFFATPYAAGGPLSPELKEASLPLVDRTTCTRYDWWGSSIKTTMVCAGGGAEAGCNVSLIPLLHI